MTHTVEVTLLKDDYSCAIDAGTHHFIIDEPLSNGGNDTGPNPHAALLASLGSCSAITMKMYAQRKGWDLQSVTIKTSLNTDSLAKERITVFSREIKVTGNLTEQQTHRLVQIVEACPISKILEGNIEIETFLKKEQHDYSTTG